MDTELQHFRDIYATLPKPSVAGYMLRDFPVLAAIAADGTADPRSAALQSGMVLALPPRLPPAGPLELGAADVA